MIAHRAGVAVWAACMLAGVPSGARADNHFPPAATSFVAPVARGGVAPSPTLLSTIQQQWAGLAFDPVINYNPPDPHGAVGPGGVLQVCNLQIAYFQRSGVPIWGPLDLRTFFGLSTSAPSTDPRAVYDPGSGRFFVIMHTNADFNSTVQLAVSKNSNPASSGDADWYRYGVFATEDFGGYPYGVDYPGLGVDGQALYATYNMVALQPENPLSFLHSRILVFNKSDIISGVGTYQSVFTPFGTGNTIQPCSVIGATSPGNVAYFGEAVISSTSQVRLWALEDPLGARTLSSTILCVPDHGGSTGSAPQPSPAPSVQTLSPYTQGNAFWFGGAAWFCHTAGGSGGPSNIYFYKVATNGYPANAPTLAEAGEIAATGGAWNYQPSIGGNAVGDVCIVFTQSSLSQNPSILFTVRPAGASLFEPPTVLKASPTAAYMGGSRWGDYATVAADPTDNSFWVSHEWARSTTLNDWGTWWGNVAAGGIVADLVLQNVTVTGTALYEATNSIVAGPAVTLAPASDVVFHVTQAGAAGITLADGFWAQSGCTFRGYLGGGEGAPGSSTPQVSTAVEARREAAVIAGVFPNPGRGSTTVEFELPRPAHARIDVFDLQGRLVATLSDQEVGAGRHRARFDAGSLAAGVYYVRLSAEGMRQTRRLVLLK